jgi:hypothetical protein
MTFFAFTDESSVTLIWMGLPCVARVIGSWVMASADAGGGGGGGGGVFAPLLCLDRLVENFLDLRGGEQLVELDLRRDLQRLLELRQRLILLLETGKQDDAHVDVRARRDLAPLEPAAGAGVQRVLQDLTRRVEVQVLELVDCLLVELGDPVDRGRVPVLGARQFGDRQQGEAGEQGGEANREGFSQSGFGGFREAADPGPAQRQATANVSRSACF